MDFSTLLSIDHFPLSSKVNKLCINGVIMYKLNKQTPLPMYKFIADIWL